MKKISNGSFQLNADESAGSLVWPSLAQEELTAQERKLITQYQPSGLVLFRRNLTSREQAKKLISELNALRRQDLPPFIIAIDQEGGRVSRLPEPYERGYPAGFFGHKRNYEGYAQQLENQIAAAKDLGVNCFLAPVADVLTHKENPALGDRCFSDDPYIVSKFCSLTLDLLRKNNLVGCLKHFPGHGDTSTDSHLDFAESLADIDTLRSREWIPYHEILQKNDTPLIMSAHIKLPKLDPNAPATLSKIILNTYLRSELKFDGLILSDDLRMNAIAKHYLKDAPGQADIFENYGTQESYCPDSSYLPRAAYDALKAGCNIILSCRSIEQEEVILSYLASQRGFEEQANFVLNKITAML